LWWGLSTGLVICGVALMAVWMKRASALLLEAQESAHG